MTSRSEIEHVLDRYLAGGGEQVPDRVIDAALDQIDQIPQRRALRVPWRFQAMPSFLKLALAGAAVAAIVVVGGLFIGRGSTANVGGPPVATASPSATPVVTPARSQDCAMAWLAPACRSTWLPFMSEQYAFEMAHPPTWTATPATREWDFEIDRLSPVTPGSDHFIDEDAAYQIGVVAFADDVPSGMSEDEWMTAYFEPQGEPVEGCGTSSDDVRPITVDGHPGTLVNEQPCADTVAFVFIDGRVNVFAIWREGQEQLLEAFLSTVRFTSS